MKPIHITIKDAKFIKKNGTKSIKYGKITYELPVFYRLRNVGINEFTVFGKLVDGVSNTPRDYFSFFGVLFKSEKALNILFNSASE